MLRQFLCTIKQLFSSISFILENNFNLLAGNLHLKQASEPRKFLLPQLGSGQVHIPSSLHLTNISLPFNSISSISLITLTPLSLVSMLTKAHLDPNLSNPVLTVATSPPWFRTKVRI